MGPGAARGGGRRRSPRAAPRSRAGPRRCSARPSPRRARARPSAPRCARRTSPCSWRSRRPTRRRRPAPRTGASASGRCPPPPPASPARPRRPAPPAPTRRPRRATAGSARPPRAPRPPASATACSGTSQSAWPPAATVAEAARRAAANAVAAGSTGDQPRGRGRRRGAGRARGRRQRARRLDRPRRRRRGRRHVDVRRVPLGDERARRAGGDVGIARERRSARGAAFGVQPGERPALARARDPLQGLVRRPDGDQATLGRPRDRDALVHHRRGRARPRGRPPGSASAGDHASALGTSPSASKSPTAACASRRTWWLERILEPDDAGPRERDADRHRAPRGLGLEHRPGRRDQRAGRASTHATAGRRSRAAAAPTSPDRRRDADPDAPLPRHRDPRADPRPRRSAPAAVDGAASPSRASVGGPSCGARKSNPGTGSGNQT